MAQFIDLSEKLDQAIRPRPKEGKGDNTPNNYISLSPEKAFEDFSHALSEELQKFKDSTFTKKEAWFIINSLYLDFVGKCQDNELREEAFKIAKYYAENVPVQDDIKETELDKPFASTLDLSDILSDRKDGRIINPDEVK